MLCEDANICTLKAAVPRSEWENGSQAQGRLCLNYYNPAECLKGVDIVKEWRVGLLCANISLLSMDQSEIDSSVYGQNISLLKLMGRKVGVRC